MVLVFKGLVQLGRQSPRAAISLPDVRVLGRMA